MGWMWRPQGTHGHLEGPVNKLEANATWRRFPCRKFYLPGSTTPLVSPVPGLSAHQSLPTKPPEGLITCPAHPANATLNCPCAQVSWAVHRLPATRSVGPWGQWAGALAARPSLLGPPRSPPRQRVLDFQMGSLSRGKVTLAISWKGNNCWGKVLSE